jgi:hypothetical protein
MPRYPRKVLEPVPFIDYTGGLAPLSGKLVPGNASPDTKNMEPWRGHLRRAVGTSTYSTVTGIDQYILRLLNFWISDGTEHLVIFQDDSVRRLNAGSWTDITNASGMTQITTSNNPEMFVSTAVMNDLLISTDLVNTPQQWNGSAANTSNLGGLIGGANPYTTFLAKIVVPFYNHLMFLYTIEDGTEYPFRALWSNTGQPEQYDQATTNAGQQDMTDTYDAIVNGRKLLDKLVVYKENSIWEGIYVGYPNMFVFSPINYQSGLRSPKSLVKYKDVHIYLGVNGVKIYDGREETDITGNLQPYFFGVNSQAAPSQLQHSVGIVIPELDEYWLAVPIGSDTYPTHIFRYNFGTRSWYQKTLTYEVHCAGTYEESTQDTWSTYLEATSIWTDSSDIWHSKSTGSGFDMPLLGTKISSAGTLTEVDLSVIADLNTAATAYWTTRDLVFGPRTRWEKFWIECKGSGTLELQYSTNEGSTWTSLGTDSVPGEFQWVKFSFNFTAEQVRFKLIASEASFEVRTQTAWYVQRAK